MKKEKQEWEKVLAGIRKLERVHGSRKVYTGAIMCLMLRLRETGFDREEMAEFVCQLVNAELKSFDRIMKKHRAWIAKQTKTL